MTSKEVGEFYDRLDSVYRDQTRLHVHHGLWIHGDETRDEAKQNLASWAADHLALHSGERCVDIGAGYGEMACYLSATRDVRVTAVTNSAAQHARAMLEKSFADVDYQLADWCSNDLPSATYDAAWAVESMEHMPDLDEALVQCRRVLKPGGRLLVICWLVGDRVSRWAHTMFVAPTVRQNHLAPLRRLRDVENAICKAGFGQMSFVDLTQRVRRTWTPTLAGVLSRLRCRPSKTMEPGVAWTTARIALAYGLGAMRYVAISASAPS